MLVCVRLCWLCIWANFEHVIFFHYSNSFVIYYLECRYCEERPLLLSNAGMGARLCTYYQKTSPADQTATSLRNNGDGLGTVLAIDPADKSPFLGDIRSRSHQSCLETNMYRSPIFPHKVAQTDYLLVRSAKGVLSLRRIDKLYAVGQQVSPVTRNTVFCIGVCNVSNPLYLLFALIMSRYNSFTGFSAVLHCQTLHCRPCSEILVASSWF